MALNFPNTPAVGSQWTDPSNGIIYLWDGQVWTSIGAGTLDGVQSGDGSIIVTPVPPNTVDLVVNGDTITVPGGNIELNPINGSQDLETILGDAIYHIGSQDGSVVVVETPDGQVDLSVDISNIPPPPGVQDGDTIIWDGVQWVPGSSGTIDTIGSADGSVIVTDDGNGNIDLSVDAANISVPGGSIDLNPINGSQDLETILGDAIYNIGSQDGTVIVTETPDGQVDLRVPPAAGTPPASEGSQGLAEIATQAEADAGTDDFRYITPLKLHTVFGNQAIDAGDIAVVPSIDGNGTIQAVLEQFNNDIDLLSSGVILYGGWSGSQGQVTYVTQSGTNAGVVVGGGLPTPATPGAFFIVTDAGNNPAPVLPTDWVIDDGTAWQVITGVTTIPNATETVVGITEIATQVEVDAGTDDFRYVTPLKLSTYISNVGIDSGDVVINNPINGSQDLETILGDAVYNIASADGSVLVTETPDGQVDLGVVIANVTPPAGTQIGETIIWDGVQWVNGESYGGVAVGAQPPPGVPEEGDLWFNEDNGILYVWYDDPDGGSSWVDVRPPDEATTGPQGPQGESGIAVGVLPLVYDPVAQSIRLEIGLLAPAP